jgi:hypothetical protein
VVVNDNAFIQALSAAVFARGGSKQVFAEWDGALLLLSTTSSSSSSLLLRLVIRMLLHVL